MTKRRKILVSPKFTDAFHIRYIDPSTYDVTEQAERSTDGFFDKFDVGGFIIGHNGDVPKAFSAFMDGAELSEIVPVYVRSDEAVNRSEGEIIAGGAPSRWALIRAFNLNQLDSTKPQHEVSYLASPTGLRELHEDSPYDEYSEHLQIPIVNPFCCIYDALVREQFERVIFEMKHIGPYRERDVRDAAEKSDAFSQGVRALPGFSAPVRFYRDAAFLAIWSAIRSEIPIDYEAEHVEMKNGNFEQFRAHVDAAFSSRFKGRQPVLRYSAIAGLHIGALGARSPGEAWLQWAARLLDASSDGDNWTSIVGDETTWRLATAAINAQREARRALLRIRQPDEK